MVNYRTDVKISLPSFLFLGRYSILKHFISTQNSFLVEPYPLCSHRAVRFLVVLCTRKAVHIILSLADRGFTSSLGRRSDHLLPLSVGAPFAHRLRRRSSLSLPRSTHTATLCFFIEQDLIADSGRASSATDCSVEVVETESGVPEIKLHLAKGFSK